MTHVRETQMLVTDDSADVRLVDTINRYPDMTSTHRILIIDDSPAVTELLAAWLADPAAVRVAHAGDDGVRQALEFRPHVLLVDIFLPRLSGFDVVEALRQRSGGLGARVIFMTGLQEPANTLRAMELGAVTVLHKPLDMDVVRRAVIEALPVA